MILLAAGGSSRLGAPKALIEIEHETLVARAADAAIASGASRVVIVAGAEREAIGMAVQGRDVLIVENREWERGIATSIRAGIRAADGAVPGLRAAVVMLCDQPFITPAHLERLMMTWRETGAPAVATKYPEGSGVPALLPRALFEAIENLDEQHGAREILRRLGDDVVTIDAIDTSDIDTADDRRTILERCATAPRPGDSGGNTDE